MSHNHQHSVLMEPKFLTRGQMYTLKHLQFTDEGLKIQFKIGDNLYHTFFPQRFNNLPIEAVEYLNSKLRISAAS